MTERQAGNLAASEGHLVELLDVWSSSWSTDGSVDMPVLDGGIATGFIHLAWAHHVVRLSEAVVVLYDKRMYLQAVPLVRQTLETAISAFWLAHVTEGGDRAYAAYLLGRRTMLREMRDLGMPTGDVLSETDREIADLETVHGDLNKYKMPSLWDRARTFQGGRDLYVHYRNLSQFAHPTFWLADGYAHPVDGAELKFGLAATSRYDQAPMAMAYQLISVCHTLGIWATIPHQASGYEPLLEQLDRIGTAHEFQVAHHPSSR